MPGGKKTKLTKKLRIWKEFSYFSILIFALVLFASLFFFYQIFFSDAEGNAGKNINSPEKNSPGPETATTCPDCVPRPLDGRLVKPGQENLPPVAVIIDNHIDARPAVFLKLAWFMKPKRRAKLLAFWQYLTAALS